MVNNFCTDNIAFCSAVNCDLYSHTWRWSHHTKTCTIHVKALNDNAEFKLHQTEHIHIVIHKECYSEVWCSVTNSRRTSLTKYGVTECHLKTSTMKMPCPTRAVELWLKKKMMCIHTYLQSVPRHKLLILDTYHLDTLYLCEQWCQNPWLSSEV